MKKEITIWSEGTRLAANLFIPDDLEKNEKRPAILLCQGWAGSKAQLNKNYAPFFSEAGFVAVTFDYRGWHESDSRLVTMDKQPAPDADGFITVRAKPVREVIDSLDQNRDIHNVLDYMCGEPCIAANRIGIWGTSFGGGHALYLGGTDHRVRCIVAQVPGMGVREDYATNDKLLNAYIQKIGSMMARGIIDTVPRAKFQPDSLSGIGDIRSTAKYFPRWAATRIKVPTLIMDQEQEEYGGRDNAGLAAYEAIDDKSLCEYHVFPGTHYDIYGVNYQASATMARDWFVKYLKK